VIVSSGVEGLTDEAIAIRLLRSVGAEVGPVYGKNGKSNLLSRVDGFNRAAERSPWLVLVDLDRDFQCAPDSLPFWLPHPSEWMCFRVAVPEAEAWLLADGETLADYFAISREPVPGDPETLPDPKHTLVNLTRSSRRRDIREEMVPRPSSGRVVGPGYTGRVIDYVRTTWRPVAAAAHAPSLERCVSALRELTSRPWPQAPH
jgi:hypothetical protein